MHEPPGFLSINQEISALLEKHTGVQGVVSQLESQGLAGTVRRLGEALSLAAERCSGLLEAGAAWDQRRTQAPPCICQPSARCSHRAGSQRYPGRGADQWPATQTCRPPTQFQ